MRRARGRSAPRGAAAGRRRGALAGTDADAWIIFTSGFPGAPMGVAVTHRAATAFDAEAQVWTVTPEDRVHPRPPDGDDAMTFASRDARRQTPECPDSGIPAGSVPARSAPYALAGLSVVLPCFDGQDTIADAVRAATRAAERVAADHEIIVVNDGSSDATATVAAALVGWDRRVRLLVRARTRGYGDALRTGIGAARMPWVLLTDPLRFDVDALETLVPAAAEADLVVDHAATLIRLETLDGLLLEARGTTITTELRVKAVAGGARVRDIGHASGRTAQHEHNTILHEAQRWLGTLPRMQQPGVTPPARPGLDG